VEAGANWLSWRDRVNAERGVATAA
jgi:hypothetical protein